MRIDVKWSEEVWRFLRRNLTVNYQQLTNNSHYLKDSERRALWRAAGWLIATHSTEWTSLELVSIAERKFGLDPGTDSFPQKYLQGVVLNNHI